MHFQYIPQRKNLCPGGHQIYNNGRTFLDRHYYILGLSDLCLGVENIVKEIVQFHCLHRQNMTYMATPQHKNLCPRGHEIYNLGRPFLVTITTYLVCLTNAWEQRRRFSKKYKEIQQLYTFNTFCPKVTSSLGGRGGGSCNL